MQKATIKDVARAAGVSAATASNALNSPEIVRPETRAIVLEAARALHYVPNANGKRLRSQESRIIGFFVNEMTGEYYGALADSMNSVCQQNGYELNICIVSNMNAILQKLQDHSVDGAIIFHNCANHEERQYIISLGFPLVFLDVEEQGEHVSSVLYRSREHGQMAARYLLGLGKQRFLHISGVPGGYDSSMRQMGFIETLVHHGIPESSIQIIQGRMNRNTAYQEMRLYLQSDAFVPDAIFAANDLSAIGCMQALKEGGFHVPRDISVIGCDDSALCEYISPSLTTIRTHFQDTGTKAAQEILRLISGEPGQILWQDGSIIVRHSCSLFGDPSVLSP